MAQVEVARNITVEQGMREERLAKIKADIAASIWCIEAAKYEIALLRSQIVSNKKRLEKARKELGWFAASNIDFIAVVK